MCRRIALRPLLLISRCATLDIPYVAFFSAFA